MNTAAKLKPGRLELLDRVEQGLRDELGPHAGPGHHPLLQEAARHLCLAPGAKRARPMLAMLFAEIASAPEEAVAEIAVVAELIHSASILHDDVVDLGELRRGRPTVNAAFGNSVAVLAGDHLLSRALLRLVPLPRGLTTRAIEVVAEMSRAAVIEVEARGRTRLSVGLWREMALGKTGALFGLCGFAAGLLADRHSMAAPLEQVGRRLGLAFQMQDDLDDLVGSGKEDRCGDLRERTPTLPLLLACARSPGLHGRVEALWSRPVISSEAACAAGEEILGSGAVEETLAAIDAEVEIARAIFAAMPRSDAAAEILSWASGLGRDPRGRA